MRGRGPDFSVGEQLPCHAFSQYEEFHGLTKRHFSIIKGDVFLAPWFVELRFDGVERNLFGKLLKTLFVELDAVHVVANQELIQFFRRCAFHGIQKLKNRKMRDRKSTRLNSSH